MALHADAIAQNRAAGIRAGGIDRDHADRFPFGAQRVRESDRTACSFPRRARPVTPKIMARPVCGNNSRQQRLSFRAAILDPRRGAGRGANVAARRFSLPRTSHQQLFSNCRAITSRWISLVPSPMVHSFTSR